MRARSGLLLCGVLMLLIFTPPASALGYRVQPSSGPATGSRVNLPLPSVSSGKVAFAFVSDFESKTLEGWTDVQGPTPIVVASPSYSGEPSLRSVAKDVAQIDFADHGILGGASSVSFQAAIQVRSNSSAYIGLASSQTSFCAVVGISNGEVVAGSNLSSLSALEPVPTGTAYPSGWVSIISNVFRANGDWVMQVFVDRTDVLAGQVQVPAAKSYDGALIETESGNAYYTDIVVSSSQLAILRPGYNNMEGYGQGSALVVQLLPAYDALTAEMTLDRWSSPQNNILSFQINAMNMTGTTNSTCHGFFQLGVDLNENGSIAPWYVPGVNCAPSYFIGRRGIASPDRTSLDLSIVFVPSSKEIVFSVVDRSTSQTFSASIPYSGGPFYGTYTQLEYQPCCSTFPIGDFTLKGAIQKMAIGLTGGQTRSLPASYMLPSSLDAPPSWDFTYYDNSTAGYTQISQ